MDNTSESSARPHRIIRPAGLMLFLTFIFGIPACTPAPPEPLRIAAGPFVGYESLYLARDLGLLDPDQVRLVEYAPGSQSLRAFRNGVVDGAALTLDEVLLLAREGFAPRVVTVLSFSRGADMVVARAEIGSLQGLRGTRIGAENTALGAYFLSRVLYFAGIDRADVNVVPLELAEHRQAFLEDKVDALITYNLSRDQVHEMGAVSLFDSSLIPGEIVDVLIVREEALQRFPEAVNSLLTGWGAAMEHMDRDPRDAARRMSPRLQISSEQLIESLKGVDLPNLSDNRALLAGDPPPLQDTMEEIMRFMVSEGLLASPVDLSHLIASSPLEQAAARLGKDH